MNDVNHFVFIGDSRIRQLYFELLKHIDPNGKPSVIVTENTTHVTTIETTGTSLEKSHQSLAFNLTQHSFHMSFYWMPVLNQSVINLMQQLMRSKNIPKIVVAGSGTWEIKLTNASELALKSYAEALHLLSQVNHSSIINFGVNLQ